MRLLPRGYSPMPGGLSSLLQAGVAKGKQMSTLLKAAKKLMPRVTASTVTKIVEYWRGTKTDAAQLRKAQPDELAADYVRSYRSVKAKLVRVGYTVEFYDPNIDEERLWGGYMDFPETATKEDIYNSILKSFVSILIEKYEVSNFTAEEIEELMANITIVSIEKI